MENSLDGVELQISGRMASYVNHGSKRVDGWLARESAEVITRLAELQLSAGVHGGVGEIGIHHGKLFILLYLSLSDGERGFALDVFEDQEANIDRSGHGSREIFLQNLSRNGCDLAQVSVFTADSCRISAEELCASTGPLKFMSIDGGHTEAITYNDMALADELLCEDGVLILDDVYRERWPAVAAGAFRFILETTTKLRPFAISPNKTFFCKSQEAAGAYRVGLLSSFPELRVGEETIFGSSVLMLGDRNLVNRVKNISVVRNNPAIYEQLSRVLHRFR